VASAPTPAISIELTCHMRGVDRARGLAGRALIIEVTETAVMFPRVGIENRYPKQILLG
jgi:hypothetical protein